MFHGAGSQQPISQTVILPINEGNAIVVSIKTSPKLGAASFKFVNTDDATAFCLWAKTLAIPFNFDKRMTEALLDPANNVAAEALEAKHNTPKEFSLFFEAPYYQQILQGINTKLDLPEQAAAKGEHAPAKHQRVPSNGHTTTLFKSLAIITDEIKTNQKSEPSKTTKETITHSPKALRPVAPQPGLQGKTPDDLVLDQVLALSRLTASQSRATTAPSRDSEIKPTGYENLTNHELLAKQAEFSENMTDKMKEVSRRLTADPTNPVLNQLWQNMSERHEILSKHREAPAFKLFGQITKNASKTHSSAPSRNHSPFSINR